MKTLLIFLLSLALAGAAAITRPNDASFKDFVKQHAEASQSNVLGKLAADVYADQYVRSCEFKNRCLWTTVSKDGKNVYTGAFGHWWGSEETK